MLSETATTLLAITRGTDSVASRTGALPFLPALAAQRFSALGGIDIDVMKAHMSRCKSFSDASWSSYWTRISLREVSRLDKALEKSSVAPVRNWVGNGAVDPVPEGLSRILAGGAAVITKTTTGTVIDLDVLCEGTIVYLFVAAWPGGDSKRDTAYQVCTRLSYVLFSAILPSVSLEMERHTIKSTDESFEIIRLFPNSSRRSANELPAVFISNGIEGTNFESVLYALFGSADGGILSGSRQFVWVFMEMPGTYAYRNPMRVGASEQIYRDVISDIAKHPLVDSNAIGMMGLSFGAYWTTRMAFSDDRLKAVVVNGAPISRSFRPWGAFGIPQIMIDALCNASGASNPLQLGVKLGALALTRKQVESITIPVLAINGAEDTLVSIQDTVDLAKWAPRSHLKLYSGDDHCAMLNIKDWLELSATFFGEHLLLN